jgi:uncharacterized protein YndB with AHSA1/START domain
LAGAERALRVQVTVAAPVSAVWQAWSTTQGAQTFLAPKTHIQAQIGGPYEIFFNPADERVSTQGCKVLSYLPQQMISFQWTLPPDMFPDFPKAATWVVVQMHPAGADRTDVAITQLGWGSGPVWNRAYVHMQRGWEMAAAQLKQRFEHGPIDWPAQHMMWKERARN